MGATACASLLQAQARFKHRPLELAFHSIKSRATCLSVIGRNVPTLLTADLHPMGDIEIWEGNQIASSIATKISITMDKDGCFVPRKNNPSPVHQNLAQTGPPMEPPNSRQGPNPWKRPQRPAIFPRRQGATMGQFDREVAFPITTHHRTHLPPCSPFLYGI